MSELVIVFVPLAVVIFGLAVMGVVIWHAQSDGFTGAPRFAPSRARRQAGRAGQVAAARRIGRPAYAGRR